MKHPERLERLVFKAIHAIGEATAVQSVEEADKAQEPLRKLKLHRVLYNLQENLATLKHDTQPRFESSLSKHNENIDRGVTDRLDSLSKDLEDYSTRQTGDSPSLASASTRQFDTPKSLK